MNWHPTTSLDLLHPDPAHVFQAGLVQHHIANTAYPIAHQTTMQSYRLPRSQIQHIASQAWSSIDRLGLYVHIPFCEVRCAFCEYTVVDPAFFRDSEDQYFDLLLREFELYDRSLQTASKTLIGFDIGGGTPSIARSTNIARLVQAARDHFILPEDVVISIETTPKIAAQQPEKLRSYYEMGIRRISMGIQTISPHLLEQVGRTATSIAFNRGGAEQIRSAGFERFNIDLMYGFASQSLHSLESTLQHAIALQPDYITLYRTRYKGTRIASQAQLVTPDQIHAQEGLAQALLQSAGYWGTTAKNTFSRIPGDVGTSDYLTERVIYGTPYLGLGLGAQSLSQVTLSYNLGAADKRLDHYQKQVQASSLPIQDLYHLSIQAAMAKMIAVSFYFGEINLNGFQQKFGMTLEQAFPTEVGFILDNGLMEYIPAKSKPAGAALTRNVSGSSLRLTSKGQRAYNGVIALFYAGAVKEHLLGMANLPAEKKNVAPEIPVSQTKHFFPQVSNEH